MTTGARGYCLPDCAKSFSHVSWVSFATNFVNSKTVSSGLPGLRARARRRRRVEAAGREAAVAAAAPPITLPPKRSATITTR